MSVSPHDRVSAIFTTVASAVCCAPEPPRSAKFNSRRDNPVWLDALYYPNITPLFFVETLADLEKHVAEGRTPEQVVGNLAEKAPAGGQANRHHETLCIGELLGYAVDMERVPIVGGGKSVESGGRKGVVFDEPAERVALHRWEEGQFLDVERTFARAWRTALSGPDLGATYRVGRDVVDRLGRPRDFGQVKEMADSLLGKPRSRYAREALQNLYARQSGRYPLLDRWRNAGEPSLREFAPYTAHVLTVDLFFSIGLGADLISRERPSNKVDMAYLYYLPFCMVFTSSDNLHAKTAPVFLNTQQESVGGQDLKADLAKLDDHYSALPQEVKDRGVMSFASYPPTEGDFLVSRLWDRMMAPKWREHAARPKEPLSPEQERKIVAMVRGMSDAPRMARGPAVARTDADAMVFRRKVRPQRGKWRTLPLGVEKADSGG